MSDRFGLSVVRHFEGLHKLDKDGLVSPYICPAGYATQGYGRRVKDMNVAPITRGQAVDWLIEDYDRAEDAAIKLSPILALFPHRLGAVASFIFNLGSGRYRASTLRRKINAYEWAKAEAEFGKWIFGGGKRLKGLVLRREAERALFCQDQS